MSGYKVVPVVPTAEMILTYDVGRCTGRMDLGPNAEWCDQRRTCKRFMAFMFWDQASGVPHYRGIAVSMAVPNCQHKIEVTHD